MGLNIPDLLLPTVLLRIGVASSDLVKLVVDGGIENTGGVFMSMISAAFDGSGCFLLPNNDPKILLFCVFCL